MEHKAKKKKKKKNLSTGETIGGMSNKRLRKPKWQSGMDNSEMTGSIGYTVYKTQDENIPNKKHTTYMLGTTICKQTQIM